MQGLAKEQLIAGILKWLPQGHVVVMEPAPAGENSVVIGWMNAFGATSVANVTLEHQLLDELQRAIETHDENRFESYLETVETHILDLAATHEERQGQVWHLSHAILAKEVPC